MKRLRRYRWIAILSTISMVGGVVISGIAGLQLRETVVEQGRLYLPAAQKAWSDTTTPVIQSQVVSSGTFIGIISIPSLKKSLNIFQGTDSKSLSKGVGHYLQSVMPGVTDNSVLAGHRDTVFSHLDKVKVGDYIVITTRDGTFIYQVNRLRIVDKNDRTVIVPTDTATLTLSTCYPFRYIGNAPQRYIVLAKLVPPEVSEASVNL